MKPEKVTELRNALGMDLTAFAKLLNVDCRTISRWESGKAKPTASGEGALNGLSETLKLWPPGRAREATAEFIRNCASVGGLAYLLIRLFELSGSIK